MNDGITVFIVMILLIVSACLGAIVMEGNWRTDCEKAGVKVSGSKVYDCKERK